MAQAEERALSLLGLSMRAGQVISGDDMVTRALRAGKAAFVLLDAGASARTRDKYVSMCGGRGISLYETSADALGRAVGREGRMVVAVKPGSLAKKMASLLSEDG